MPPSRRVALRCCLPRNSPQTEDLTRSRSATQLHTGSFASRKRVSAGLGGRQGGQEGEEDVDEDTGHDEDGDGATIYVDSWEVRTRDGQDEGEDTDEGTNEDIIVDTTVKTNADTAADTSADAIADTNEDTTAETDEDTTADTSEDEHDEDETYNSTTQTSGMQNGSHRAPPKLREEVVAYTMHKPGTAQSQPRPLSRDIPQWPSLKKIDVAQLPRGDYLAPLEFRAGDLITMRIGDGSLGHACIAELREYDEHNDYMVVFWCYSRAEVEGAKTEDGATWPRGSGFVLSSYREVHKTDTIVGFWEQASLLCPNHLFLYSARKAMLVHANVRGAGWLLGWLDLAGKRMGMR